MEIKVAGSVLRSYRQNRNLTLAMLAERTRIAENTLQDYEQGEHDFDQETLERLAKAFKVSWFAFLDDEPEQPASFGQDNRSRSHRRELLDADTQKVIEEAEYLLDLANEINPDNAGFDSNGIGLEEGSPEYIATKFREYLGVKTADVSSLTDEYAVLRYWKEKLSEKGLYVFEKSWSVSSVRAFSLIRGNKAAAVLSTKDGALARVFSLLHETYHLIHNQTGICDLHFGSDNDIEVVCNRFSAAVLMPEADFRQVVSSLGVSRAKDSITEDQVKELRKLFKASRLAVYRRLLTLGYISKASYETIQHEYENTWTARRGGGGGSYYRNRLNEVGKKYALDMLAAYANNQISVRNLADVLKVRVSQLPEITNMVGGNGHGS